MNVIARVECEIELNPVPIVVVHIGGAFEPEALWVGLGVLFPYQKRSSDSLGKPNGSTIVQTLPVPTRRRGCICRSTSVNLADVRPERV